MSGEEARDGHGTRVFAFYLPQFHPIAENDEWWGEGFTEWRNVAQARPRFSGHHQPQIPADLGFYDLRVPDTRQAQAHMAAKFGISGFCYYHYWFNGRRLLDRPLNEMLESKAPDFPFMLCWANENWTRAWDGLDRQVLIAQEYTVADAERHIAFLIGVFSDRRYVKIDGKPVLLVYRPDQTYITQEFTALWRGRVVEAGFPGLYLCAVKTGFVSRSERELLESGFDAVVDFQPNKNEYPAARSRGQRYIELAQRLLPAQMYHWLKRSVSAVKVIDYRALVAAQLTKPWPGQYRKFPCVFPSWDNTARRKTPVVIQNDDAGLFGEWLRHCHENVSGYPPNERLIFVNAWNEWAEGCHLEPDLRNGLRFLQEVRTATGRSSSDGRRS